MSELIKYVKAARDPEDVKKLLNSGTVDVNYRDEELGETALHLCPFYDEDETIREIVFMLWQNGADVNAVDLYQCTPLMKFLKAGSSKFIIELLLAVGADVRRKDRQGNTALHYFSFIGLPSSSPSRRGAPSRNALHDVIVALLERGPDINAKNHFGQTPLMVGIEEFDHETVQLLINNGADVQTIDGDRNCVLHYLSSNEVRVKPETVELLIKCGAPINWKNEYGETPVLKLIKDGCKSDIAMVFISADADINWSDSGGRSPLYCLTDCIKEAPNDVKLMRLMLENGADVHAKTNDGETILMHYFEFHAELQFVESMIVEGAALHPRDARIQPVILNYLSYINSVEEKLTLIKYIILEDDEVCNFYYDIREESAIKTKLRRRIKGIKLQVSKLKTYKINSSLTLYDFCTETARRKLGFHFSNCDFDLIALESQFPDYIRIIKHKLDIGRRWCEVTGKLKNITFVSSKTKINFKEVVLNPDCMSYIIQFLSYSDMIILKKAAE